MTRLEGKIDQFVRIITEGIQLFRLSGNQGANVFPITLDKGHPPGNDSLCIEFLLTRLIHGNRDFIGIRSIIPGGVNSQDRVVPVDVLGDRHFWDLVSTADEYEEGVIGDDEFCKQVTDIEENI